MFHQKRILYRLILVFLFLLFLVWQPTFAASFNPTMPQTSLDESIPGDDDDDNDNNNDNESYGLIDSFPANLIGDWMINGVTYTADANTQFEQEHGSFSVGICVEVKYVLNGGLNVATEIETKEPQECQGSGGDGSDDDSHHLKGYGLLSSFPANLIGEWVINGLVYVANANTEFEQEYGAFAANICVEIQYVPGTPPLALEIETEPPYKCAGNNATESYSQVYGAVNNFPATLVGPWQVQNVNYTAIDTTRFEQTLEAFFINGCVEVKYRANTSTAVEIGTVSASKCDNDSGNEGSESKLYGIISLIPDGFIGTWTIGGTNFESTNATKLEQEDGGVALGQCAEVSYTTSNGVNQATEIESSEAYHCTGNAATNKSYGVVESLPTDFYGSWVVSGLAYEVTADTKLEREDGGFAVGACVKIDYYTQNGVNQATEIETESSQDCAGGPSSSAASGTQKIYATVTALPPSLIGSWVIGGVSYTATAATEFEQEHGNFAEGSCIEATFKASNILLEVETEQPYKCQANGAAQFTIYGAVTIMPAAPAFVGTWEIGGNAYETDANTKFEQAYGFFAIGAYVEVKYILQGNTRLAVSLETHVAPSSGRQNGAGLLASFDASDDWQAWVINDQTYQADPVINVGSSDQAPQLGQPVIFNSYQRNSVNYLTSIVRATQVFLPLVIQ